MRRPRKKKPKPPRGFPIQPGIYRLHGIDPDLPQNDLEPLRQILGKASIVGLGESVHTSGGYYEMKHRVFRFLAEKMAHNFHIAKDADTSQWSTRTMGTDLREMFGSSYVSLALIANVSEIDWLGVGCGETRNLRLEPTIETMLHDLGHETLLVDLDFPGGKPPFLAPGESYRMNETGMIPADQFDGAFFLERSRKMDPLRWPSCQ